MAFLLQDGFQIRSNPHTVHVAGKVLLRSLQSSLRVLPLSSVQKFPLLHKIDKRRRESFAAHTVVDPSHTSWSFDFSRVLNGAEMSDDGFLTQ
ncbi:hypothetical protein BVC80_8875g10 [Macleaya cordata]|uniref:Uncharacterized protein n=1 Tax=Macleaya cordata TaxID=56857 RepID=A0A200Q3C7_MACCD|nr:hypothetical protein BVC80_8875g10 [Macleaya cordata]